MIGKTKTDRCIVGDYLDAQCKRRMDYYKETSSYTRHIITLRESATCKIRKCCDNKKDSTFISKLQRAFSKVDISLLASISANISEDMLKCDNCLEPNIPKNKHAYNHKQPPFKIERIDKYPVVCYVESRIEKADDLIEYTEKVVSIN